MIDAVEYRSVIKFLVLRQVPNDQIFSQLEETYGEDSPSRRAMYKWIALFKHGRQSVFDDERTGRPCEISDKIHEKCESLLREDRRITTRALADAVNVSKGTIQTILHELGVRKLASRFVPRFLSAEMCEKRLECSQANLLLFQQHGEAFLRNIITQDETPLTLYLPESKRESSEWKFPGESSSRKMRSGTSHRKCLMLSVFWDARGVILVDFAEKNTRLNSAYYSDLVCKCRHARRKERNIPMWFLQDNAPIHKSAASMQVLEESGFDLLDHPPYSPDLAPSDFYLFRFMKKHLRGKQFANAEDLREEVESFLRDQSSDFFKNAFSELIQRWQKCVNANGSYVEK
jgi:[histone H3]-lysine36 N-dimethyltransferase SETMAR